MQSRKLGLAMAVLAAAVAVVLFVVLRDEGSDSGGSSGTTPARSPAKDDAQPGQGGGQGQPKEAERADVVVRGGQPVGGVQELTFENGGRIRFIVESNVADEVHLHGYDIAKDVDAGGDVSSMSRRQSRVCSRSSWSSGWYRSPRSPSIPERRMITRVAALAILAGVAAGLAFPEPASAHALVGRQDLPIPTWLFAWGASLVLIVSFVAFTVAWRRPAAGGRALAPGARLALAVLLVTRSLRAWPARSASSCSR